MPGFIYSLLLTILKRISTLQATHYKGLRPFDRLPVQQYLSHIWVVRKNHSHPWPFEERKYMVLLMLYFSNDIRNYNSDMPFHKYTKKNVWHAKFFNHSNLCKCKRRKLPLCIPHIICILRIKLITRKLKQK